MDTHALAHAWAHAHSHTIMQTHIDILQLSKQNMSFSEPYQVFPHAISILTIAMHLMGTRYITEIYSSEMFGLEAPRPQKQKKITIILFVFPCFNTEE